MTQRIFEGDVYKMKFGFLAQKKILFRPNCMRNELIQLMKMSECQVWVLSRFDDFLSQFPSKYLLPTHRH